MSGSAAGTLIGIAFISVMEVISIFYVPWMIHLSQTIEATGDRWGRGDAKKFWGQFGAHVWTKNPLWPESWFSYGSDSRIHASVFQFDGRGMVLDLWSLFWVNRTLKAMGKMPGRYTG